jgi:hypothetical protein
MAPYNAIEQEIIILCAAWDMVNGMVNYSNFQNGHALIDAELRIRSEAHGRLLNILLADFLSKPAAGTFDLPEAEGPATTDHTHLFYLRQICDSPHLNDNSAALRAPVSEFSDWLEATCSVENVWFPSIDVEANITVKRIIFLKICGDTAKHNFARLDRNVRRTVKVLASNGVKIDVAQGFMILDEFYDWFHDNIFAYHLSTIAEYLNNIRWGIFEYLTPEFEQSFHRPDPADLLYRYRYPADCRKPLAKAMYWELMNHVRSRPWIPRFNTTPLLKIRY